MSFEGLEVGAEGWVLAGGGGEDVEEKGGERVRFWSSTEAVEGVSKKEVVEFDGLIFGRDGSKDGEGENEVLGVAALAEDEEELFG